MNDKNIKELVKNAYRITPSEKERQFLKKNEQRSMKLWDVIALEIKYRKLPACLAGAGMTLLFFLIAKSGDPQFMWYVSGALPVLALIFLSGLGRSERYGMKELEASGRFSQRFVRASRLIVPGAVSPVLLVAVSLLLREKAGFGPVTVLGFVGTPYMLNAWGNLLITRKWHGKESMAGCLGMTALTCLLPMLLEKAVCRQAIRPAAVTALLITATVLTVRESILYIRESEDLTWNYCWTA